MNNNNFITIQGWMINELGLKGNELILYAIIYGFSQDGKSEYYGSLSYIQNALKISRPTAIALIKKLIKKNLIERTSESHYKIIDKINNQKTGSKETLPHSKISSKETLPHSKIGSKETLLVGSKETLPNKYNTNNNNTNVLKYQNQDFDLQTKTLKNNSKGTLSKSFKNNLDELNILKDRKERKVKNLSPLNTKEKKEKKQAKKEKNADLPNFENKPHTKKGTETADEPQNFNSKATSTKSNTNTLLKEKEPLKTAKNVSKRKKPAKLLFRETELTNVRRLKSLLRDVVYPEKNKYKWMKDVDINYYQFAVELWSNKNTSIRKTVDEWVSTVISFMYNDYQKKQMRKTEIKKGGVYTLGQAGKYL